MRSERGISIGIAGISFTCLAALATACGGPRTEAQLQEQAVVGIDGRHYEEVIGLFEGDAPDRPPSLGPESLWLLAQAHLGAAGFEPLHVQSAALASQHWRRPGLGALYATCPATALPKVEGIAPKCLLKRLANSLPDVDNPHLSRAIELFGRAHPDPATTPAGRNVLIGAVVLGRAIARAAVTLEGYRALPHDAEPDPKAVEAVFTGIGRVAADVNEALRRGRRSPDKVSQLIAGAVPDLERAPDSVLARLITLGEPRSETPETAVLKFSILQQIDELLAEP